jgi:hypothetical protein
MWTSEDDANPEASHCYMDILIGRDMGKNPELTRGRLIFELFDDIMPVPPSNALNEQTECADAS